MSDKQPAPERPPMSRRELEEKIVARAWTDEEFRRKFVTDPKAQFEEHLGTKLPEAFKLTVHEETPDSLHFVIPMKPAGNLDELSDEDLENVVCKGGNQGRVCQVLQCDLKNSQSCV